jgi:hypothetical protein
MAKLTFSHNPNPTQLKRYVWPFAQTWFSICSKHQYGAIGCDLCETGQWVNDIKHRIGSWVFKLFPSLWRWWANR